VRFADGSQGLERQVDYAVGYAKKMGKKTYQQRYDDVPRELRTFMSQRLEIPPAELDNHRDLDVWEYHGPEVVHLDEPRGGSHQFVEYLEYVGHREHLVPIGGRCSALDYRRTKRGPPVKGADSGALTPRQVAYVQLARAGLRKR
jgi:hypothetical protein